MHYSQNCPKQTNKQNKTAVGPLTSKQNPIRPQRNSVVFRGLPRRQTLYTLETDISKMRLALPRSVWQFMLTCIALEVLSLSSQAVGMGENVRSSLVAFGGFWPDFLTGSSPHFVGQGVTMFGTSVVLHVNLAHLAVNMFGIMWLGPMVTDRLGDRGFWFLAGLSAVGAGLCYTLLSTSNRPMVGASGVLYGLLGAIAIWVLLDRLKQRQSLAPYAIDAAVLIGGHVILTLAAQHQIAWQAHLGGFLAGAVCGFLTWRASYHLR